MCRVFDAVTAVSEEDKQSLIEAGARPDIEVIPIAIDTDKQAFLFSVTHRTRTLCMSERCIGRPILTVFAGFSTRYTQSSNSTFQMYDAH